MNIALLLVFGATTVEFTVEQPCIEVVEHISANAGSVDAHQITPWLVEAMKVTGCRVKSDLNFRYGVYKLEAYCDEPANAIPQDKFVYRFVSRRIGAITHKLEMNRCGASTEFKLYLDVTICGVFPNISRRIETLIEREALLYERQMLLNLVKEKKSVPELKAGDFLLTRNEGGQSSNPSPGVINHVAVYIGDGKIVEAQAHVKDNTWSDDKTLDGAVIVSDVSEFFQRYPTIIVLRSQNGEEIAKEAAKKAGEKYCRFASIFTWLVGESCVSVARRSYHKAIGEDPNWLFPDDMILDKRLKEVWRKR
jgi:hypothetical protein